MAGQIQILDGMSKTELMLLKMMVHNGETAISTVMATISLAINQTIVQTIVAILQTTDTDVLIQMLMVIQTQILVV